MPEKTGIKLHDRLKMTLGVKEKLFSSAGRSKARITPIQKKLLFKENG